MIPAEYSVWKECFNRWLRILYLNFVLCCSRHELYGAIKWKHSRVYALFCRMVYDASSKEVQWDDDNDT